MINILFIASRWYKKDATTSILNTYYHNFYSSLSSTGLGEYKLFEVDYEQYLNNDVDNSLINIINNNKFDIIMFLSYFETYYKFDDKTWEFIKNTGIPIVICHGDVLHIDKSMFEYCKYGDLIIHMDCDMFLDSSYLNTKIDHVYLPPPQDPGLYFDFNITRDIPIIISGTISFDRKPTADYLLSIGEDLPIYIRADKGIYSEFNDRTSPSLYALDYMRSKLSVVMLHNSEQVVGHIFESMLCGCCTFVNKSNFVSRLFRKNIDYVEYEDMYDLADKLIYYLDNEDDAKEIANNGKIAMKKYSAYNFYTKIFNKLGVSY